MGLSGRPRSATLPKRAQSTIMEPRDRASSRSETMNLEAAARAVAAAALNGREVVDEADHGDTGRGAPPPHAPLAHASSTPAVAQHEKAPRHGAGVRRRASVTDVAKAAQYMQKLESEESLRSEEENE